MHRRFFGSLSVAVPALVALCWSVALAAPPSQDTGLLVARADRLLRAAELYAPGEAKNELYLEAEKVSQQVLERDPDSAAANFILFAARGRRMMADGVSKHLFQLGSLNTYLTRALELDPSYANALAAKGGLLLDLPFYLGGDAHEAERYLERAVALNPTGPGTRMGFAKALLRNGHKSRARENLRLAAHYACLTGRAQVLTEAANLLSTLDD